MELWLIQLQILMLAHNHVMKKFGYSERQLSDMKKILVGKGSKVNHAKSFNG